MKRISAAVVILFLSIQSFTHEYWLEPDNFFISVNQTMPVRLFLGEGLKKEEERPFQLEKTTSFMRYGIAGNLNLLGANLLVDNSMPVYTMPPSNAGSYLMAMERNWSYIKLGPKEFEDYLREDGMEYIIAERKKLGESQKEGRERYARFIKGLIQVGDKRDATFNQKTGYKLEITPYENPYSKKAGDNLRFQIIFNGKPLPNAVVFADNRDGEQISKVKLLTDKRGNATVKLDRKGTWLVRLVYMQRCKTDCAEADWESFWGAFSFGIK